MTEIAKIAHRITDIDMADGITGIITARAVFLAAIAVVVGEIDTDL